MNAFYRPRVTLAIFVLLATTACAVEEPIDVIFWQPDPDVSLPQPDASIVPDAPLDGGIVDSGVENRPDVQRNDAAHRTDADANSFEDEEPPAPLMPLANGIALTGIEVFQTIESVLLEDGEPQSSPVLLIAGREALFRLLVTVEDGWAPKEITAELLLTNGETGATQALRTTQTIATNSSPENRSSALEVRVPGELIEPTTNASFRLLGPGSVDVESPTPSPARWPRDASTIPLEASDSTGTLHLVIVPMRFDTDGSGRLPDTSPEQLTIFEDLVRAIYPAAELRIEVREPISWTNSVRWGDFNTALRALKQADGADHAYYYGLIRPKETFEEFCIGTCTTGQSFTVSSADATSYRVGSGVGFSGERWAWTLAHELGHMLGRGHSPCGVSFWSADGAYPHNGGITGVRGWDSRTDTLYGPSEVTDYMGYCSNLWVSDYTYLRLILRLQQSHTLERTMGFALPSRWRYISWSDDYAPTWAGETIEVDPSTGDWAWATFYDLEGVVLERVEIPLIPYAHDNEYSVLVPEAPEGATRVQIDAAETHFSLPLL